MATEKNSGLVGNEKGISPKSDDSRKSLVTRERILEAARKVFSELPYNSASMRMIGSAGDFDHPLIRYYFTTKADLFEAVVAEICEDFDVNYIKWLEGLDRLPVRDGLALFLDRFLDYNFKRHEIMRIISLNISLFDELSDVPGYLHIPKTLQNTKRAFQAILPPRAPVEDIDRLINSFNSLAIFYLGASSCQGAIVGMDSKSDEYRIWVKDTFLYIFVPLLKKLVFPD